MTRKNTVPRPTLSAAVLLTITAALLPISLAEAQTFQVGTTFDQPDADPGDGACASQFGFCTLRAAIQELNAVTAEGASRRIEVPAGTYPLTRQGLGDDTPSVGDLDIRQPMTIEGVGGRAVIDAQGIDRVFDIQHSPLYLFDSTSLRNLEIVGGEATDGGGVLVRDSLAIVQIESSVVRGNQATRGGGIYAGGSTTVLVSQSLIAGNSASFRGGGAMFEGATASISASTWASNDAPSGSAIFTNDSLSIVRSTVSGHSGADAALYLDGTASLYAEATTFAEPASAAVRFFPGTTATFDGCLIRGGCRGAPFSTDGGGNLESPGATCDLSPLSSLLQVPDPRLRPLAYYGGPTPTHALLDDSPARDLAPDDSGTCSEGLATDQRSAPRSSTTCDAGSFEFGAVSPLPGLFSDGFESGDFLAWSSSS